MATADPLDGEKAKSLIIELGGFFAAWPDDASWGLAESLQVWFVNLADFRESLLSTVVWPKVWHHQIGPSPGQAAAYARSKDGRALGVFFSALARDVDGAIREIDLRKDFADDKLKARLLVIPEVNFTGAWINNPENSLIILGKYAELVDPPFEPLPASEVRDLLQDVNPIEGLTGELKCT